MSRTFLIKTSPNGETNSVYMNPDDVGSAYASIGQFVYRCEAHTDVLPGHIAMNAIQRRQSHTSAGDLIQVSDFHVPMVNFDLKVVTLKATWLKANVTANVPPPTHLANAFRACFEGHVLTKGQKFTMNYDDEIVYFTVESEGQGVVTMNTEVGVHWTN